MRKSAPISEAFTVRCRIGNHFLTTHGTLIGAIALGGRDPDGLTAENHTALSQLTRSALLNLDRSIDVLQCYAHFSDAPINLARRDDPVADLLSAEREKALREKRIGGSNLVFFLECAPYIDINRLNVKGLLKHGLGGVYSRESRRIFSTYFRDEAVVYVQEEELQRQALLLNEACRKLASRLSGVMTARVLSYRETWAQMRFLATLDPRYLVDGLAEPVPEEDIDVVLASGDVSPRTVGPVTVLKLNGAEPRYCRIASVTTLGKRLPHGVWGHGPRAPISVAGDYVIVTRWSPMSELLRAMLFKKKQTELERASIDFFAVMQGHDQLPGYDRNAQLTQTIREKIDELGHAEKLNDVWGTAHAFIAAFGGNIAALRDRSIELDRAVTANGVSLTWEDVDIDYAFATLQPGGKANSIRDLTVRSEHMAAASLVYRSAVGQPTVEDLGGEEAQYIFETASGEAFYYSDFIGERSFVIGVGPTRSGKTFLKNTLTSHFLKYGGYCCALDSDPGTETLAMLFGEQARVFRLGGEAGLNPFVMCRGAEDRAFIVHLSQQLLLMLAGNDDPALRTLEPTEQDELDNAIRKTLALPIGLRRLSTLVAHMPPHLARKFKRWVFGQNAAQQGRYAPIFDAQHDCIGPLVNRLSVFNLQRLREDPVLMKPLINELFYRVTTAFEDPRVRAVPKHVDIDEAKYALSIPSLQTFITEKVRTWGKLNAGITLWSQSPEDYLNIDGWDAIRTAATTFLFLADPKMDDALYRSAFKLSKGECEAIKALVPRKEVYIVQPELGVSKTLILDVEPTQHVVNTSHPRETQLRERLIQQHGFEKGIQLAAAALNRGDVESVTPHIPAALDKRAV